MRLSRKPYAPFWQVSFLREVSGPYRDSVIGVYLPGCIVWLRRPFQNERRMKRVRIGETDFGSWLLRRTGRYCYLSFLVNDDQFLLVRRQRNQIARDCADELLYILFGLGIPVEKSNMALVFHRQHQKTVLQILAIFDF